MFNTGTHKRRIPEAATSGILLCYRSLCRLSDCILSSNLQIKYEATSAATDIKKVVMYNTGSTSIRAGLLRILEDDNILVIQY